MKTKFKLAFAKVACEFSELSSARRAKVGCIIVKDDRIISIGYNGMPSGWDNECEDWVPNEGVNFAVHEQDRDIYGTYKTKPEVLHAETNAIAKLARSTESGDGASLFCTHTPCLDCAKLIYQSGISSVYYIHKYEAAKGCGEDFLIKSGITVEQIDLRQSMDDGGQTVRD